MTKTKLINQCKFPAMIAGKMKLTQVKSRKTDKDILSEEIDFELKENNDFLDKNLFFSGNTVVVEQRVPVSSFDLFLLLQIVEFHQKMKNSVILENKKYKRTFDDEDKQLYKNEVLTKCFNDIDSVEYETYNTLVENQEARKNYVLDLIQAKADEQNKIKWNMFAIEKENYYIEIDVIELLKARKIKNQIENREVIRNSLLNLFDASFCFYFLKDSIAEKIKDCKKGKKYAEWKDEVREIFNKNKSRTKQFHRHIIESFDVDNEITKIKIQVNKGFLDYCEESRHFDYTPFAALKSHSSKAFFTNCYFEKKDCMSKEYVFDIMDLKHSIDSRNVKNAILALEELVKIGFLDEKTTYDKKSGNFYIVKKQKASTDNKVVKKSFIPKKLKKAS